MRIGAIASVAFFLGILLASTAAQDGKLLNFAMSLSSVSAMTHHASNFSMVLMCMCARVSLPYHS